MPGYYDEKVHSKVILYDLIKEYGSLQYEQVKRFMRIDESWLKNNISYLKKRGRLCHEENELKIQKDITTDVTLQRCFWVLVDLAENIECHFKGTFPLYIIFFINGKAYEVYYCASGNETVVVHMIEHYRDAEHARTLIVLEEESQMQKIRLSDVVFCMVGEKGEVTYYE